MAPVCRSSVRANLARWLGASVFSGLLLAGGPARAEPDPLSMMIEVAVEALRNMNFHSQVQGGLFAVSAGDFQPGGFGARAGFNVLGFGGSVGARIERYPIGAGGLGFAEFEFRPMPFLLNNFYRVIDPYATAGIEIGGGDMGFRMSGTVGVGVDLGLFGRPHSNREVFQPVLSVRYQFRPLSLPDNVPQHLVQLGAAARVVF